MCTMFMYSQSRFRGIAPTKSNQPPHPPLPTRSISKTTQLALFSSLSLSIDFLRLSFFLQRNKNSCSSLNLSNLFHVVGLCLLGSLLALLPLTSDSSIPFQLLFVLLHRTRTAHLLLLLLLERFTSSGVSDSCQTCRPLLKVVRSFFSVVLSCPPCLALYFPILGCGISHPFSFS